MALSVGELVAYLRLHTGTFDKDLTTARGSLDLTGKAATRLGGAVDKSEVSLRGASRAAQTVTAASGKLRAAQLSVVAAQERYNALMVRGEGSTARLASAEAALIRSQQRLAAIRPPADPGGFAKLRQGAMGALATIGKLGLSLGVFELAMKGIELVKSGNEFAVALNGVAAASQGTDAQMAKARSTAVALGKDLTIPKATAIDAAVAMEDLVKSGVSLDRAMVAARPALLLAAAAQVSIADAARVTGDVMDDFRLKADKAGHVANVLAAASNSAGGGLMDLFDGMKYAGPTARTLGLDVDVTSAALVLMAKSGHQGSIGGTAFANMLTRLNPVSKNAKEAMADLGINAWTAQGKFRGLPVVVDQMHRAMERMSPAEFSKAVQIAFGNRARLAVFDFAHGGSAALDVFYKKMKAGDVQEYANTMNRGLTAAGAQIRKIVTSWAIDINSKFSPALAKIVFAIGDELPGAVRGAQHTLEPLEQEFSAVLVPALHVTADVLGLVGHGLVDVAGLLEQHRGTVQIVATVVVGMWAAWKGYAIAKTAVQAVTGVVDTLRLRAMYAKQAIAGIGTGATTLSAGTLALGALGIALGVAAYAYQKHQAAVAADKQQVSDFTAAIKADSGALGENTKAAVFNALQKQGAIDAAKQFGINLSDLTDASLGNEAALGRVNATLAGYSGHAIDAAMHSGIGARAALDNSLAYNKVRDAVDGANANVKKAVVGYQDEQSALAMASDAVHQSAAEHNALATSLVYTVDASGALVQAQQTVGGKVNDTTEELVKQKSASDLLKASLDALNGVNVTQEQTTNAFLDSLDGLTASVKTNGRSLNQNTTAGRKNREQIVSMIQAAKDQAQATADTAAKSESQTEALKVGNAQLRKNEDRIRSQAKALGLSKGATDKLIKSLGQLTTIKPVPTVDADTKPAEHKVAATKAHLDDLRRQRTALLKLDDRGSEAKLVKIQAEIDRLDGRVATTHVNVVTSNISNGATPGVRRNVPAFAAGTGGLPDGWFTVGEQGWELGHKRGNKVELHSHQQSKRMLPQGPSVPTFSVPAFASGTAGRKTTPYEYDGIYYATAIAAANAETRARRRKPKAAKPITDTIVATAGHGSASGIASYIRGAIPSVVKVTRELSTAVNDAFQLKGIRAKVSATAADLAKLKTAKAELGGNVTANLLGQVEISKYGDLGMLRSALQAGTAGNNKFAAQQTKLAAEHVPTSLIALLAKDGPSAGLATLAGANKRDLAAVVKDYSAFTASSAKGGAVASNAVYGSAIKADERKLATLTANAKRYEAAVVRLVAAIGRESKKPVQIKIDGKVIAHAVITSGEFSGVMDDLTGHLEYGTGKRR